MCLKVSIQMLHVIQILIKYMYSIITNIQLWFSVLLPRIVIRYV